MEKAILTPCSESKFPNVPALKFFEAEGDLLYFGATHYLNGMEGGEPLNVAEFLKKFDYQIEAICHTSEILRDGLTVTDDTGNIYLDECLVIPFLMYAEEWFGVYVCHRMEELLRVGVTLNDDLTKFMYESRFGSGPTETP
ncbi:MAG: hypothetical protein LBU98_05300 [Alistipes sp.]|jgi:hypothetical protein|nr:hypothetical protein [Alistipes sp.]